MRIRRARRAGQRPSCAGKAAANALRVAGLVALVEEFTILREVHIQRASTLMDYHPTKIQRLTEQEPLNKLRAADCLLRRLTKKNWPPFRLHDLTRNGPRFARKSTPHIRVIAPANCSQLAEQCWEQIRGAPCSASLTPYAAVGGNIALRLSYGVLPPSSILNTLSPRANPNIEEVLASVAAVAIPTSEPIDLVRLIEHLQVKEALLQHSENALLIRPAHGGTVGTHQRPLEIPTDAPTDQRSR